LSPSYLGEKSRQGLVLGFGSTPKNLIPQNVRHLRAIISAG